MTHRSQEDFEDEIRSHLELEAERLRKQGMSARDAEIAARKNFGNVAMAQDRFHGTKGSNSFQDLTRDMRHALRGMLRTPGFFITAVGTLALAIGAVTGMFSVVNTVMLRQLPYPNPDDLVAVAGTAPGSDLPPEFGLGNEFYLHYKERSKLIEGLFTFSGGTSTLRTNDRVERIPMAWPTNDMYKTLGVRPQLGRLPVPEDGDDVVVITDRLWNTWFGRDPSVIGKSYFVSDSMKQIVGVLPESFKFPWEQVLLFVSGEVRLEQVRPGNFGGNMIARKKPGVSDEQLTAELTTLAKELPGRFGGSPGYARVIQQYKTIVAPMLERMVGPVATTSLWILLAAVALVLLIACANVANLFLVRAEGRSRDLAVRRAIGASRAQLVRYQMAEAFMVAIPAGVLAIILSALTLPLFLRSAPEGIPRLNEAGLDLPTIGAAFALVILVALACGAVPALRASSPDLRRLREGGRGSTSRTHIGRDLLVVGQTAIALVLLIGSALLVQSFQKLRNVDPGYDTKDLYTFQYAPDQPALRDGPSLGQMHLNMMSRIRALPGVQGVGVVNNIPLDEGTGSVRVMTDQQTEGGALIRLNFAGGDYFKVIGINLLAGRTFTTEEAVTPNNSVIVSRATAQKLWPGRDAVGQQIRPRFGNQDTLRFTVVGMVEDVKQLDWREPVEAVMYLPLTGPAARTWGMNSPAYVVKSPRGENLKNQIRGLVREVAPEAPVYREYTMDFLAKRSMVQLSFTMLTLGVVSALALILGALGLYGVLSYVVAERTKEIGVRMALGATTGAVRRMVVTQGTRVVVLGALIGVAIAMMSTRFLERMLYEVKAVDPVVFVAMSVMLIAVGVLASYMPARRASAVDPIESLRSD